VSGPRDYGEGLKELSPVSLRTLGKRAHIRVVVPPSVVVYARLRKAGSTGAPIRCVLSDISAGGAALSLTEGMRFDLPGEGQEVQVELDFDGGEAQTRGRVVRSAARELSLTFPGATSDEDMNVGLLSLIARLVTRRVEHLDRRRFAGALRSRLLHEQFQGSGHLEVRVQTAPPAWWQIVFLDYLVQWREGGAIETGVVDRASGAQLGDDPLRASSTLLRHQRPWTSLRRVAAVVVSRCAAAQPEFAPSFASMSRHL
jgi:hypothetical protein